MVRLSGWGIVGLIALASVGVFPLSTPARADTLPGALSQAYMTNPQLNAQRAAVRATDEAVPQALAGYRPRLSATASVGPAWIDTRTRIAEGVPGVAAPTYSSLSGHNFVQTYGATVVQPLFDGFQTPNRSRQAESQVRAAREILRLTEQTVLLQAATAYMDLIRDMAIRDLQRRNVDVLGEQLRQTRDRFDVGEVTRTDVAQSESRLSAGRSSVLNAEANFTTSRATYRQVVGTDPGRLASAMPVDRFSPPTLGAAINLARSQHPSVQAAAYNVDQAEAQVRVAEGSLYPSVNIVGSAQKSYGSNTSLQLLEQFSGSIAGQLTVPIYQGGAEYSQIRQAKEILGQRRIELDTAREQVRQQVVQAWGQLEAARAQITATQSQVSAAEVALNGVREEARVGQRTTLDVLNAQQELVNARVAVVTAQRDRVVSSYTLLAAVGRLGPQVLGLKVPLYDVAVNYHEVRDSWFGLRSSGER